MKKRQNCTQLLHINPIKIYAHKLKKNLWDESKTQFSVRGTDTSGLLSGLVTIRSGDCGAKFKIVGNLRAILISSLFSYPEANLYQFANHPEGFQFTIPNPDLNSVSIS